MILKDEAATAELGANLARRLRPGDVITLSGGLGVGKTTLVRGMLRALGHEGEVPSPSFAIVQPYEHLNPPVLHVDLYRLEDPEELMELGLDMMGDGVLLIEWPEHGGEGAFADALRLNIAMEEGEGMRRLTWTVPSGWEGRWP
ncbi:tRNA (adenosine(37)-N6)-threonylcarbamoyltransferase complex ATPase subunit type 1 TsaE [Sphingomicrobium lutaoense]|uniref:tRNA threonylcarbamoyladenosine biosynthesis protein TsaE n=1 Tax=Sphingomicrobium lutaoense TaxID=515949 RepID=A0A839Z1T6_9SPHN|nr:tRNA (adenosine(37)-N6)-threonylcarbamoyltransferase complex ATPase subunit type 1 TsaE [Sphingomicrobium lutaoense]MBB3763693.1 tRNA threonylcarbamoyladenosine biosynthesis protein TsaE [Sphingomicrobium lutaoense]